jgi:hypothetical protein
MHRCTPAAALLSRAWMGIACAVVVLAAAPVGASSDGLRRSAAWQAPDVGMAVDLLIEGLEEQGVEEEAMAAASAQLRSAWKEAENDRLNAFVEAAASVVPAIEQVTELAAVSPTAIDEERWEAIAKPLRDSIQLWAARHLVRMRLYDEALPLLVGLTPSETVDPAACLFYRAVCNHALLNKTPVVQDLELLLSVEEAAPVRFVRTARLMLADIEPLREDSLDEISRLMSDVGRRLDLGRSGQRVLDQEQEIIDKLSKLIDQIEEQQQQQQQQQQAQSESQGGSDGGQGQPMDDSRIAGGPGGVGDVDRRNLGDRDGWGNLPPAERQESLQQIGRDLPTHYREAIEAYFRKLATERN